MRRLLFLALFMYDVINANRLSYDYEDIDNSKRHSFIDDRRNWRKKALNKFDQDPKDWDERRRYEENPRYLDDVEKANVNRKEYDSSGYSQKHLEDLDKARYRSTEIGHSVATDKESERKTPYTMNCERPHERYEACFSGCAAITCDNPRERLRPCYPFCEPGCICIQPYVRDDRTHKCVLPEDCTKGLKGIPDLGEDV